LDKKNDPKKLYLREQLTCRTELSGKVFNFEVRIEDIDTKGILTNIPDLGGHSLSVGQEVLIRYYRSDSAYQFLSKVIETIDKSPRRIRFGFPKRITRYQRRQQPRAKVTGTVKFFPPGQLDQRMRGFILDLSAGGIQFSTKQVGMFNTGIRPEGRPLMINISADGGNEFIGIEGSIRRVKTDYNRGGFVNVQVKFTKMSPSTQQRIYQFVKRRA